MHIKKYEEYEAGADLGAEILCELRSYAQLPGANRTPPAAQRLNTQAKKGFRAADVLIRSGTCMSDAHGRGSDMIVLIDDSA